MSQENVEVVQRSLEAFEDDVEIWLGTLDPDVEWYPLEEGNIPSHGHGGAMGIRERWLESWDNHSIDVEELRGAGENVMASVHISGRGKGSGVDVDLRVYLHWKVRQGKIIYLFEHADRAAALKAAGLQN